MTEQPQPEVQAEGRDPHELVLNVCIITSDGHMRLSGIEELDAVLEQVRAKYPKVRQGPTVYRTENKALGFWSASAEDEDVMVSMTTEGGVLRIALTDAVEVESERCRSGAERLTLLTYAPQAWMSVIHPTNPLPKEWETRAPDKRPPEIPRNPWSDHGSA